MNVPTNVSTRAISIDEWDANAAEPEIPEGAIVYAGLDLASVPGPLGAPAGPS